MSGEATGCRTGKSREGLAQRGRAPEAEAGKGVKSRVLGIAHRILGNHNRSPEGIDCGGTLVRCSEQVFYRTVCVLFLDMRVFLVARVAVLCVGMAVQAEQQLVRHHGAREQQQQKEGDICRETVHLQSVNQNKVNRFLNIMAMTGKQFTE